MISHPSARRSARLKTAFVVGQNRLGQWLAIATDGLGGGIFASQDAALRYAESECAGSAGRVRLARGPIELRI
ncbi:hypothetical protein EK403_00575 [Hansschlegelia zhihuaiae]|uniref:RAG2 PHD domain containing protein n=1 Tax=Hansschlegelia zhihuaiae TaxID=405005 RepID=A0A4Q0MPE9_9HYPH|nr:hypothetical protein EK403_00575 [Hansschlegelia zhihuaiae]